MGTGHPADTGLPVEASIGSLRHALSTRGAAVLQAEPGAGKSTVVPLRLLGEPWLGDDRIVMLEPRRLATRATARRMAHLLGDDVGGIVGYRTRDDSKVGRSTSIEVVTEGILTRRLQRDPSLPGIGLIIFDEVHERNLQSDLALALTLDVRRSLRPDLAVLAMSATIDVSRTAALLGDPEEPAVVVTSTGRNHPVDLRWIPRLPRQRLAEAAASAVLHAMRTDPGDVLVFLPGAGEIRRVAGLLVGGTTLPPTVDVHQLFGALSTERQDAALNPSAPGRRRVVLSTDIAETSLTVEGVRVVIDAGEVRRPAFDHRSGLTRLATGPNSRASADQRSGRAGRTEPGVAYRLWAASEHSARPAFAAPEISTVDLTGLALELAMWGASAAELPFLDQPPTRRLEDAQELLRRLDGVDDGGRPTPTGRAMAELPLHPRLAHMIIRGHADGHGWLACVIAALLEERDVLRGHPSGLPIDIEERVRLVIDPKRFLASADGSALATARRRAKELARRADISTGRAHGAPALDACGTVLALAYPDRIAQATGGGEFRLRNGQRAATPHGDPLGAEQFLVVAEIGPDDQVRIAAAIGGDDLEHTMSIDITSGTQLVWDDARDELTSRTERRLGAIVLGTVTGRPAPGPDTADALARRARRGALDVLNWTAGARALQERAEFARRLLGDPWPDVSDAGLIDTIEDWLTPVLVGATRRADLERIDVTSLLRTRLGHHLVRELDRALPGAITIASGRSVRIDYDTDPPSIAVKPQELFGPAAHPTIAQGRLPLAVHLLSPGGRVVQVTSDLPGFWAGSWVEVRKELAGRYPKHEWPTDPANASPLTGLRRRR